MLGSIRKNVFLTALEVGCFVLLEFPYCMSKNVFSTGIEVGRFV